MMIKLLRSLTLMVALVASILVTACGGSRPSPVAVAPGSSTESSSAPRSSPSTRPTPGPDSVNLPAPQRLTELIAGWRSRHNVPGVIVGMRLGDGEPLIVADGEDAETGEPLPADALFDTVSITKTFAGALALDLIDGGELGLDDPIESYVPGFPNGDRITVRHLLAHTSGLYPSMTEDDPNPYGEAMLELVVSDLEHSFTPEEHLELVKDRPLEFAPGQAVRYSNVNTVLLGEVIESVTGTEIGTAFRERLIDPLRLHDTYYRASEEGPPPVAGRFRTEDGSSLSTAEIPDRALFTIGGAGGGMVSTAADLLDWGVAFLRAGAVDHVDLSQSRFQVAPNGAALGVITWSIDSGWCPAGEVGNCTVFEAVTGIGNSPWGSSMLAYFPRWDLTVVAYSNADGGMRSAAEDLVAEIMRSMVGS